MNQEQGFSIIHMLGLRFWLVMTLVGVALSLGLGDILIRAEAFEVFYSLTRQHEELQLDDWAVAVFASLLTVSVLALISTFVLGKRLIKAVQEKQAVEHRLAQGQQLIAMGTMLGGVAHSINNHLTPVIALAEMMRADLPPDSDEAQDLSKIAQAAFDASGMLNRLKGLARSDNHFSGQTEIGSATTNAVDLARKVSSKAVSFRLDIQPLRDKVALSAVALEVVLINLINNAIDAMQDKPGRIGIALDHSAPPKGIPSTQPDRRFSGAWVRLQVSDNGRGMTGEEAGRMFDPFFTTKPVGKGTGLGLSETFGIIDKAGGVFDVSSSPGQGTQIGIYLPVLAPGQST